MSNAPRYFGDKIKPQIPTPEHHQVLALVAPRPFLVLGGDSADGDASWPFIKAVLPVYELLGAGSGRPAQPQGEAHVSEGGTPARLPLARSLVGVQTGAGRGG
jgi:hypothetical protein